MNSSINSNSKTYISSTTTNNDTPNTTNKGRALLRESARSGHVKLIYTFIYIYIYMIYVYIYIYIYTHAACNEYIYIYI